MEAPPKQLANAQECLNEAVRLISEVRFAVDALDHTLPATFLQQVVVNSAQQVNTALNQLRSIGKSLESSGVLVGAQQRYQDNQPLALHMPLVASDGAVVAYSWKRQIAGQAAASAVERTSLALKAFKDQQKRFMPQLTLEEKMEGGEPASLTDVLKTIQEEAPEMTVVTRGRPSMMEGGATGVPPQDAASLELMIPGVFKAGISLYPSGSVIPDAVAIFSTEESSIDPWDCSTYRVFQLVSGCANNAMYVFRRDRSCPLLALLQWLFSYRTLFTKPCRHCNRILNLDQLSNQLVSPTYRPYLGLDDKSKPDENAAYHSGCFRKSNDSKNGG